MRLKRTRPLYGRSRLKFRVRIASQSGRVIVVPCATRREARLIRAKVATVPPRQSKRG